MNNKNNAIIPMLHTKEKGIVIDPYYCDVEIGDLKKINYPNFKYKGICNIENKEANSVKKNVHFVQIVNIPDNLINEITNTINHLIENKSISVKEYLNEIIDYFKKVKFVDKLQQELFADIGEAIFILDTLKNGISSMNALRKNENSLYDFKFNDLFVEVKPSSKEKNEFKITYEEITQSSNKNIVIVKFKIVEGETNILDLYEMINKIKPLSTCDLLWQKQQNWKSYNDAVKINNAKNDLINDYSIILDNCSIKLFDKQKLPIIDVKDKASCKKIELTINCTDSELSDISELYNLLPKYN